MSHLLVNPPSVAAGLKEMSDEKLASFMKNGDDAAFEELYERYFLQIYRFVISRVRHAQVAEDLVSDIFFKAFEKRRFFVWKTSFKAWVYRIAVNAITDYYRTRKISEDLENAKFLGEKNSSAGHIDQELLHHELEKLLSRLEEREQLAVSMKFYGGCDYKEIARALKTNENHTRVILYRALRKCEAVAPEYIKQFFAI